MSKIHPAYASPGFREIFYFSGDSPVFVGTETEWKVLQEAFDIPHDGWYKGMFKVCNIQGTPVSSMIPCHEYMVVRYELPVEA
jgi:hypothetical protein